MGMETILKAIGQRGEREVQAIEQAAFQQANEITAAAWLEAGQIKEQAFAAAVLPASRERARIIHRARLEALRLAGDTRERLVDAALDQLHGYLRGMRNDPRYSQVLRRLTQETLDELAATMETQGGHRTDSVLIEACAKDQELLENLLGELGLHIPICYELDCWGGVIGKSQDGQIRVINTIEARLERITPYLRRYLAALFESETCLPTNTATPA